MTPEEADRQMKWDLRYLELADHIAQWSKDPSTKVGAVLVDQHNCLRAAGYNGLPAGITDTEERLKKRVLKYPLTIHAEANVLGRAPETYLNGYTLYSSFPTCLLCAVRIIQRKVNRVVCWKPFPILGTGTKWMNEWDQARWLYVEANIEYKAYRKSANPSGFIEISPAVSYERTES